MTRVKDYMTKKVQAVSQEDPIARVRNIFLSKGVSRALVYNGELIGMITDGDIARAFTEERREINQVRVREIMTRGLITTEPGQTPEEAAEKMMEEEISGLPVVKNSEVRGIITNTDLARYFTKRYRGKVKIKDLMSSPVHTIKEGQSAFHAGRIMEEKEISKIVVEKDEEAVGIVTEKDLSFASPGKKPRKIKYPGSKNHHERVKVYPMIIGDIMQEELVTTHPEKDAATETEKMIKNNIGSLVVTKNKKPVGIITKTDIANYLGQKADSEK